MGNSLRCCLACVLPCGALDLIRIVHLNGCVEELSGRVNAGEFLMNFPNHVLTKPTTTSSQGVSRRILIVSPESDLKRGSIYFLVPSSSLPAAHRKTKKSITTKQCKSSKLTAASVAVSSRRRKVAAGVWRPRLHSIYEEL